MEALRIENEFEEKTNMQTVEEYVDWLDKNVFLDNHKSPKNYDLDKDINNTRFRDAELFGIAAHHVRHRIQKERDFELFSRENVKVLDHIESRYFQSLKNIKGKSFSEMILTDTEIKKLDEKEFDAVVIEILVDILRARNASKMEIVELILQEEPKHIPQGIQMIEERLEKND